MGSVPSPSHGEGRQPRGTDLKTLSAAAEPDLGGPLIQWPWQLRTLSLSRQLPCRLPGPSDRPPGPLRSQRPLPPLAQRVLGCQTW